MAGLEPSADKKGQQQIGQDGDTGSEAELQGIVSEKAVSDHR